MRKALIFMSFFMLCLAASAQVLTRTDEFTKATFYTYETPKQHRNFIRFIAQKGHTNVLVELCFPPHAEWEYLECHFVDALADDSPLKLSESEHDGDVGDGYVIEHVTVHMELAEFQKLAFAKEAKIRVCNTVFTLSPEVLAQLRVIYADITEDTQGKKAEKQTAPSPAPQK
jgi:hypothetical protein